jgi:predicted DNA-binding antitoxin AbrB/MazE fold protein
MQTLEAVFDGKVLLPGEPLELQEGTRVRITVEPLSEKEAWKLTPGSCKCSDLAVLKGVKLVPSKRDSLNPGQRSFEISGGV